MARNEVARHLIHPSVTPKRTAHAPLLGGTQTSGGQRQPVGEARVDFRLGDTSHLEVKVVERQLDGRIGHSERVHEGRREVDEVEGVVGQGTRCVRVESGPFQGRVPRDDVAAVLALLVRDDRFSRRVFYVNSGEDPIERALERVLAS